METFDVAVVGMGALGSAATYYLARSGVKVVSFEQYELGHSRGASHDTSRIVRTSYGARDYVRLAQASYRDWTEFEAVSGEKLLTITGGVVFIPGRGGHTVESFRSSLAAEGAEFEILDATEVAARWPQFRVPGDVETVYSPDSGIAHATRTVAAFQMQATLHGATVRERTRVTAVEPGDGGAIVRTSRGDVSVGKVVIAADAWTNELLEPLDAAVPLEIMQEQVTYFKPADPARYDRDLFPVWIWLDEHCFYGFPTYGEPTVKAARDVGENYMTPQERTFEPSPSILAELQEMMHGLLPGSGPALRTVTCQYALTPDRRFIISPAPAHPDVIVGLGAGHAFKHTPTFGRLLAELALERPSMDLSPFAHPGLMEVSPATLWR